MEDKTQKERLEQELRFLKESFEAEVISKEEYEKGKERIEKKLKDIKLAEKEQNGEDAKKETLEKQEKTEETKGTDATVKEERKIRLNVIQDETEEHTHFEPMQVKVHETEKIEPVPETPKIEIKEDKNEGKFFKYAVVFVVLLIIIFFSYSFVKEKRTPKGEQTKFTAACNSNEDCKQEGKEGFCINPATQDAKCEFKAAKSSVVVLNDRKDCFNCDTQRVLGILENWFGAISIKEIDYNTEKGRELAEKFDANVLPMYILDENITKKPGFEQFKQTIVKKDNSYILSEDAAGSAFYFKRDNLPNKLDLFVIPDDKSSISAEKNLKEFLEAFKEAKFEKHTSGDKLTKELGIKSFPAFLVNDRVKFSGVQSAGTIKENFCKLNNLPACEATLSKNLI